MSVVGVADAFFHVLNVYGFTPLARSMSFIFIPCVKQYSVNRFRKIFESYLPSTNKLSIGLRLLVALFDVPVNRYSMVVSV